MYREEARLRVVAVSDYDPCIDDDNNKNEEEKEGSVPQIDQVEQGDHTAPDLSEQLSFQSSDIFEVVGEEVNCWWLHVQNVKTHKREYIPSTNVVPLRSNLTTQE